MQSGNGMTMQEAEQEIKYYQKIFQVARLLKGEDVERTFYQQGKGTCENVQDGCPCYSFWKKNGKCENCSSYKALREKKQMIKLEFLESEVYQVISRYMEIDGQPYVMELINHLEDDTLIDISCREKLINKLTGYNEKLYKDVLTGVYNRLYFEEEIKMWTGNAGIVVIDVDDFKLCNDTYGHLTGDMALAAVAGVIWRCIRREDTLVRYGGDEFVLVLPEIKEAGLVEKLQEIQEKIQNAVIPRYSNIQLSVSMGAVISQNESVEHAMLRAHKLMYQAKNKKNMAITENNMIDHEGKIHAQQQPEKMIPEILVVDDEEVNRTLLDMIFSKDYHVLQAESGEKCIEILEQQVNSISLVLLDVVLPKMDGFDVLTYMNKNHWIEDIPVIMMSGACEAGICTWCSGFCQQAMRCTDCLSACDEHHEIICEAASADFPDYRADQRKREKQRDADSYSQSYCGVSKRRERKPCASHSQTYGDASGETGAENRKVSSGWGYQSHDRTCFFFA